MKNKITDLNNTLFAQLERLSDEDLKGDELQQEINRAKSITEVSAQIISNTKIQMDAAKMLMDGGYLKPESAQSILSITNGS